jgi:pyruvate/2-oxoacid:ferredoxin oxidoreductase alpha subunit
MDREDIILDFIKNTIISLKEVLKPDEIKTLCDAYVEIKQCEPTYKEYLKDIVSSAEAEEAEKEEENKAELLDELERTTNKMQEYEDTIVDALEYIARLDGESMDAENIYEIERILKNESEHNHIPFIDL